MERRSADIGDELVCAAPAVWAKSRVHTISPMDGHPHGSVGAFEPASVLVLLAAIAAYTGAVSRLFLLRLHQSDWMEVAHHEFWNSHHVAAIAYCVHAFCFKGNQCFSFCSRAVQ